jgi:hypothetical protein
VARMQNTLLLNRGVARFLGANANGAFDIADEHLAVADFAGAGGVDDGLNGLIHQVIRENDFDFDFWKEIDGVLAAAVDFSVPLLASEAFNLGNGETLDPHAGERFFDFFEFEGLDDGVDFFHFRLRNGDTNNEERGGNRKLAKSVKLILNLLNKREMKIVT